MRCPKCKSLMEEARYERASVDRCEGCNGIWFHPDALSKLKKTWMAEILDTGDPSVGKKNNAIDDVDCPKCGLRMDKVVDERQTHIWYEMCPDGHGAYFDAGEFTDLRHDTLMDRVRDLVTGQR